MGNLPSRGSRLRLGEFVFNNPRKKPDMIELRKQISLFVPLREWKAIRQEAARQRIPMTELCRRWIKPGLEELHRREGRQVEFDE